jgi:hypothetical protein
VSGTRRWAALECHPMGYMTMYSSPGMLFCFRCHTASARIVSLIKIGLKNSDWLMGLSLQVIVTRC